MVLTWFFGPRSDRCNDIYKTVPTSVNQTTCNDFVYDDLGRYPLYINRYVRITIKRTYFIKTCI